MVKLQGTKSNHKIIYSGHIRHQYQVGIPLQTSKPLPY